MRQPSTSSRTPKVDLYGEPFSLGFEGERYELNLRMLLIPSGQNDGEYIAVYRAKGNDNRFSIVWRDNIKWFAPDATLELIAYIHMLRGYL
jgi:hypothetical protein